jgi:predicted exporter
VPVFAVAIKQAVSEDIHTVSSLSLVAIVLLFLLVLRSIRALMATVLLMSTTVCVAVLATQAVFGFVHGLTLALGTTLIGVCIDYPIHAMVHGAKTDARGRRRQIGHIWPAMIIGGVTTVIGYLALGLSGFPGLQQIALFSAAGILTALLLTRFILPDLMDLLDIEMRPRLNLGWLLEPPYRQRLRLSVVLVALLGLLAGVGLLRWSTDLATLSPGMEELKLKDQEIRSHLISMEPGRFILAEGATLEQALQTSEHLEDRLRELEQSSVLEAHFSPFPWLASGNCSSAIKPPGTGCCRRRLSRPSIGL